MGTEGQGFMPGPVTGAFIWPFRTALYAILVIGGLWLACVIWQTWYAQRADGPDAGADLLGAVLDQDIEYAGQTPGAAINSLSVGYAVGATINNSIVAAITGSARTLMNAPERFRHPAAKKGPAQSAQTAPQADQSQPDLGGDYTRKTLDEDYGGWTRCVTAASLIFAVRTANLIAMLPLAALLYIVALFDGFAARAERRACAGRESAGLYHRAKLGQIWGTALIWMTYLAFPSSVDPIWFMLAVVACPVLLGRVQAKWMKKYI